MFDQIFSKVASFQWFKVVKPGKRRRGAQRQGELDCLHEQFICYQYLHQFQQVSAPGSWRPCREGQRSNWDESTEEPRDHGICRLENSIKLLDSPFEGKVLASEIRCPCSWDEQWLGGWWNPLSEQEVSIWRTFLTPYSMTWGWFHVCCKNHWGTSELKLCWLWHVHTCICQYIICHISESSTVFPINNDEHLLYTRPPSTPGVTEMRLSCTSGQDVLVSSPDLSLFIRCRYLGETSI